MKTSSELVTVAEAAKLVGKSSQAIYDLIRVGRLKPARESRPILLSRRALKNVRFGRRHPTQWMRVEDVAKHFGITASAVRYHIARGALKPRCWVSGRWYFDVAYISSVVLPPVGRPKKPAKTAAPTLFAKKVAQRGELSANGIFYM